MSDPDHLLREVCSLRLPENMLILNDIAPTILAGQKSASAPGRAIEFTGSYTKGLA